MDRVTIISSVRYIRQENYAIILVPGGHSTPIIEVAESVKEKSTSIAKELASKLRWEVPLGHPIYQRDIYRQNIVCDEIIVR